MPSRRVTDAVFRRVRGIRSVGLMRSARILLDRSALKLLERVYGFHPWHASAPVSARPYRRELAALVNTLEPTCVVDVGCGLGSLLSFVRAPQRFGYDVDAAAIAAARLLRGKGVQFIEGDMTAVAQQRIDVLILVNWIHGFSPERLADWLKPLLPRTRYLLVDSVDQDGPTGYPYRHDFAFLGDRARCVSELRVAGEPRRFLVYEVQR